MQGAFLAFDWVCVCECAHVCVCDVCMSERVSQCVCTYTVSTHRYPRNTTRKVWWLGENVMERMHTGGAHTIAVRHIYSC